MERIADGFYRLGSRWVNFYLIDSDGAVTIVDAGLPSYLDQVQRALAALGRKPSDIRALVLTHSHSDHVGTLPALIELTGAPVLAPRAESEIVTGERKPVPPKGVASSLWRPTMLKFIGHVMRNQGMKKITVPEVVPYDDGDVLDVPGKLRTLPTPGHSAGHTAFLLDAHRALLVGDAMATLAVSTGRTGPMLHPFNEDRTRAVRSLEVIEGAEAELLLPGHGQPWRGTMADAVKQARRAL